MKKLLRIYDKYILKAGIIFLLLFIPLYPKIPSINIERIWVHIRVEDFMIFALVFIWLIQLIRKKTKIQFELSWPIFLYWIIGFISLVYSILFISPNLANFFPHVAVLSYLRRIEYIVLFFIAFSTIKNRRDIIDYFIILCLALIFIIIYGLGQHFSIPNTFCFPSFQTGNEEFAKGIPLCLPHGARITSTFSGHYDLAAYLVFIIPIILTVSLTLKKNIFKILTLILFAFSVILLILTASRISFVAYLTAVTFSLTFYKKKLFIIPVIVLSFLFLVIFSESTAKRFLSTFRLSSVVTNEQGQLVGEVLPKNLKNHISYQAPAPAQNLQYGSGFIGLPEDKPPAGTSSALVRRILSDKESNKLNLASGSVQISTLSGSFLIKKVLVYDISFTTRIQAEWPRAINAFLRNPFLGSGYSTVSLATDNDYIRALGETGIAGLIAFLLIFILFGITVKEIGFSIKDDYIRGFIFGVAGGVIGLTINALLIDVFEASKVAENLWMILGISAGTLMLYKTKSIKYLKDIKYILTSKGAIFIYLFCLLLMIFWNSFNNFFVGDDFTWLKWAASSVNSDIPKYFTDSHNFFYRPLDKTIVFYLYNLFSFQPPGYHLFILLLHLLTSFGVYLLTYLITGTKKYSFLTSFIFLILPAHSENIFWFSTISVTLSALFIIYAVIAFYEFRKYKSALAYVICFILTILSFLTYEISVVIPLFYIIVDLLIIKQKKKIKSVFIHIPFILLIPAYFLIRYFTHAFTTGGDYSYSLTHFIPNIAGNIFGYSGLFIAGENFLPFYDLIRSVFKKEIFLFLIIFLLLLVIIYFFYIKFHQKIIQYLALKNTKIIIFGIIFAVISLMPYLPLGNIAPRYIYLASAGFAISLIFTLRQISHKIFGNNTTLSSIFFITIILIISIFYYRSLQIIENEWKRAGDITKNMLIQFRLTYENLGSKSNIYFLNTPIKYQNAWVFPVGLPDSLWLIYRDNMPVIYQISSAAQIDKNKKENYLVTFDQNYNIKINKQ